LIKNNSQLAATKRAMVNMLRTLFKSDIDQLLTIENAVHVIPWTEETFKTCFLSGYQGWVIEVEKVIIGFVFISLRTDECHILNLCVAQPFQKQGYGRKLLAHALQYAKRQGMGIAYLEVRRSNLRAITLYQQMNFYLIGERKDYYPIPSGREDALIFAKSLCD
jgi:ribosomal-protein-alanine N-acetyltransferase